MNNPKKNDSTRLVCGKAYLGGITSGLDLLGHLRSDRYKAKSPETGLDLEQIATHSAQAVSISLAAALVAIATWFLKLLLLILIGWAGTRVWTAESQGARSFWQFTVGLLGLINVILGLFGAGITAYELIYWRWSNARRFLKRFYNPNFHIKQLAPLTSFLKQRIIEPEANQNVVTFGGFRPFLGAGEQVSGWTLAIERKSTDNPDRHIDIPVQEFYQAIDASVDKRQLPHLQQLSQLFVSGHELETDSHILTQREAKPIATLPENEIWTLGQGDLESDRRAYRVYRYADTTRDLVLSYFVRFYNIGSITFVEGTPYTLTSLDRQRFSLISTLNDTTLSRAIKTLIVGAILFPFSIYVMLAFWRLAFYAWRIISWWRHDQGQKKTAQWGEEYNYGLLQTFRESVAAPLYQNYYGIQDLTLYWKALDEAVFTGVVDLLKEKGVDASQFEEATNVITNNGIMMNGGEFTAAQVAAGHGASPIMKITPDKRGGRAQRVVRRAMNRATPG